MTDSASDLVKRYTQLDDWVTAQSKRFDEAVKPARTEMDAIKSKLHEMLLALGSKSKQSISTDFGTAYTSTIMSPKVLDREAYLDYVLDNWDTVGNSMLKISAPQVDALRDYMDTNEGKVPPGVDVSFIVRVNIRRS